MSPTKVDVMRRLTDALNAGEIPTGLLAADLEIVNSSTAVTDATYTGPEGMRQWRRDLIDVLEPDARFEMLELIDAGEDRLVTVQRIVGTGASSGMPMELTWASTVWIRDGKLARAVGHNSRAEALAAAGLPAAS